jgi:hypothetical protein
MNPLGAFGIEVDQFVVLAHGAQASLGMKFSCRVCRQGCANNAV